MTIYQAFSSEHNDSCAALLAKRHQGDLAQQPYLPRRFTELTQAHQALQRILGKEYTQGYVALDDNQVIGYMLGTLNPTDYLGDYSQGWVYLPAYAVKNQQDIVELYARIADDWVKHGCYHHYTLVSASDYELQDTWFSLSFGREQAHGLLVLDDLKVRDLLPDEQFQIRLATPDDARYFREMANWITRYQVWTPTFAPVTQGYLKNQKDSFATLKDDEDATTFLAFKNGELVGYHVFYDAEQDADNLLHPEGATELVVAATHPDHLGTGVGRRLSQHALRTMQQRGYNICVTDWRTANRASSHFWQSIGFKPTHYRLVRRLDERIGTIYKELYS